MGQPSSAAHEKVVEEPKDKSQTKALISRMSIMEKMVRRMKALLKNVLEDQAIL